MHGLVCVARVSCSVPKASHTAQYQVVRGNWPLDSCSCSACGRFCNPGCKERAIAVPSQVYWWVPQNDVLGHSRVKAIISHCGTNSMYEVPIPFSL